MARSTTPEKSERAFRTISEAAEIIGVPQHVLRFWETRFPQLQPLKRGGNRRYYRPADMALLETIRAMLHDRGLTIRGARLALAEAAETPGGLAALAAPAPAPAPTMTPTVTPAVSIIEPVAIIEPEVAAVPIATAPPVVTAPSVDLGALRAIRDRLRYALAA